MTILIVALGFTIAQTPALSQPSLSPPPSTVTAGVWLANVLKFELSTGSYDLDFFLWFNSTGNPTLINYDFMNGQAYSIEVEQQSDDYLELRVRGSFLRTLDFRSFPFDRHQLTIEIEDKNASLTRLILIPDEEASGIDPRVNVPGWNIEGWNLRVEDHEYAENETFSRLIFDFTLAKPAYSSALKTVVPISVIAAISLLAFLISPSNSGQRIGLGVSTLTAAVANHLTLTTQTPAIGYLTLADKVVVTAYGLFLYGLIVSVLTMRLVQQNRVDLASTLSRRMGLLVPVVTVTLFGSIFLLV